MAAKVLSYAEKVARYGKERIAEQKRRYYEKNREAHKAKAYAYREKNKERHKQVCREYSRKKRRENPEWEYNYALRKRYGITLDDYRAICANQGNACAICREQFDAEIGLTKHNHKRRRGVVDHCHDSQVVRGILCDLCNVMLGSARDDQTILQSALRYLATASAKRAGA